MYVKRKYLCQIRFYNFTNTIQRHRTWGTCIYSFDRRRRTLVIMTKGNNWLCFLVITAVLGWEGDDVSLRLAKEALHRMGIDPNRPFLRDTAMNSFVFVQHVFNQIQEKQNDLRISPDRDPRVQFYNSLSGLCLYYTKKRFLIRKTL